MAKPSSQMIKVIGRKVSYRVETTYLELHMAKDLIMKLN